MAMLLSCPQHLRQNRIHKAISIMAEAHAKYRAAGS